MDLCMQNGMGIPRVLQFSLLFFLFSLCSHESTEILSWEQKKLYREKRHLISIEKLSFLHAFLYYINSVTHSFDIFIVIAFFIITIARKNICAREVDVVGEHGSAQHGKIIKRDIILQVLSSTRISQPDNSRMHRKSLKENIFISQIKIISLRGCFEHEIRAQNLIIYRFENCGNVKTSDTEWFLKNMSCVRRF